MRNPSIMLLFLISTLSASPQPLPAHVLLEETVIHSGAAGQFESGQKDYCAAVVRGGAPACLVYSTATFGESNRYITLLPFTSFLHYDQGKYTDKGLTPEEARALSARRSPTMVSNHESALTFESDISFVAPNEDKPLNLVTEYRLHTGASAVFLQALRNYALPAARKSGIAAFEVFHTVVGESSDRILVFARLDDFAQLDQPDLILGHMTVQQRNAFEKLLSETVEHIDTCVMRYRSNLSATPEPSK
jgi:hypothetical protein